MAYLLYRIGREVLATRRHLDEEELRDLHAGRLAAEDRAAFRRASQHLSDCAQCRDRFDRIVVETKGRPGGTYLERRY